MDAAVGQKSARRRASIIESNKIMRGTARFCAPRDFLPAPGDHVIRVTPKYYPRGVSAELCHPARNFLFFPPSLARPIRKRGYSGIRGPKKNHFDQQ